MKIHHGYDSLQFINPVVTIGIFDGVHLGHMALLEKLISKASECNGESVVMTFNPHPRLVLDSNSGQLSFLTTLEEKETLLAKAGTDHLIIIEFTSGFSMMKASDFVKNILVGKIGTKHLIVGHDHHFGYQGEGNFDKVKISAEKMGFVVEQVEGLETDGVVISSSRIRDALQKGRLEDANLWLGYGYSLRGLVVEGKKIGRRIGFPTANIEPLDKNKLIPANGVYAVEVQAEGPLLPGMLSIGTNPTVNEDPAVTSIEVNIINFEGDIYGGELEIIFRHRLRDEIKFDNTDELAHQMMIDRDNAMRMLK